MQIDFAFNATPAKCRLLISLTQYDTMHLEISDDIRNMAKLNMLEPKSDNIEEEQTRQFLSDMRNRCAVLNTTTNKATSNINLEFICKAAKEFGHDDIILFAKNRPKAYGVFRNLDFPVVHCDPIKFFLDENFTKNMIVHENHLAIFDMDEATLDPSGFTKSVFMHFKKIWAFVENYQKDSYPGSLIKYLNLNKTDVLDTYPDIANGILELGRDDSAYYPKLKLL